MFALMHLLKRIPAYLTLGVMLVMPAPAYADAGYFLIPWLSIDELYDDNLFYRSSDEVSDYITRINPVLEAGYESQTLNWIASYGFNADYYHRQSDLNSSHARQHASGNIEYQASQRWTLSGEADYVKTDTPADLSLFPGAEIPGLQLDRTPAQRMYLRPVMSYKFAPNKTGLLAYTLTDDTLIDITETHSQIVEANLEHQLSSVNLVTYGYLFRHYRFKDKSDVTTFEDSSSSSNTPWIGLTHEFSLSTRVSGRIGPVLSDGSTQTYLLLSVQHTYPRGQIAVNYAHDQTILLGAIGPLNAHSLDLSMTRRLSSDLEVGVSGGFATVTQPGFSAKLASAALEARYRINPYMFITSSYRYSSQRTDGIASAQDRIDQSVFQVGLTFTRPRSKTSTATSTRPN